MGPATPHVSAIGLSLLLPCPSNVIISGFPCPWISCTSESLSLSVAACVAGGEEGPLLHTAEGRTGLAQVSAQAGTGNATNGIRQRVFVYFVGTCGVLKHGACGNVSVRVCVCLAKNVRERGGGLEGWRLLRDSRLGLVDNLIGTSYPGKDAEKSGDTRNRRHHGGICPFLLETCPVLSWARFSPPFVSTTMYCSVRRASDQTPAYGVTCFAG